MATRNIGKKAAKPVTKKAATSKPAKSVTKNAAAPGGSAKAISQLARIQKAMDKLMAAEEALSREIDKLADILGGQHTFAAGPITPRLLSVVPVDLAMTPSTSRKRS